MLETKRTKVDEMTEEVESKQEELREKTRELAEKKKKQAQQKPKSQQPRAISKPIEPDPKFSQGPVIRNPQSIVANDV